MFDFEGNNHLYKRIENDSECLGSILIKDSSYNYLAHIKGLAGLCKLDMNIKRIVKGEPEYISWPDNKILKEALFLDKELIIESYNNNIYILEFETYKCKLLYIDFLKEYY